MSEVHWVIQENIYAEEGFDALIGALTKLGLSHSIHKVVPFVGEITDSELVPDGPVIVMGSYSLARQAVRRGWKPGAFLDNLDFRTQWLHWTSFDRNPMLNADARITRFDDVAEFAEPRFLRPVDDTKAFTGAVIDWPAFVAWRDNVREIDENFEYVEKSVVHFDGERVDGCECPQCEPLLHGGLTLDTLVMSCEKKEIYSETRTWIVDGRVVTASGYKTGTLKRYTPPEQVDARITDFAQECADIWCPNRAFVLDVADTPNGLKIVEVNNLNSAGWYRADLQRLVAAIEAVKW